MTLSIVSPGLYFDVDTDHYFADPCIKPSLTQSVAKILIELSPLHARQAHPRLAVTVEGDEEEETAEKYDKAKAIGNAAHAVMLGRGKKFDIIDLLSFKSKAAQELKASAISAGREPILRKHWLRAQKITLAAKLQLAQIDGCESFFKGGDAEVVAAACENGLWLRTMIDWLSKDLRTIVDYKTSGMSVSPYAIGNMMANAGWHVQAAMHERILDNIDPDGAGRRKHFFVAQEQNEPFALTVSEIGEGSLTMGRKQLQYAVDAWAHCTEHNFWPGYPARIIRPEFPGWKETAWLNREIAEDEERPLPRVAAPKLNSLAGG